MGLATVDRSQVITAAQRETAAHEVCHCLYGTSWSMRVERTSCWLKGESSILLPFARRDLSPRMRKQPQRTTAQMTAICGMLLAPYYTLDVQERFGHPMRVARGQDLEHLQTWEREWSIAMWMPAETAMPFQALCMKARAAILTWALEPGRMKAMYALTDALLEHQEMSGETWHRLARQHTPLSLQQKDAQRYADTLELA